MALVEQTLPITDHLTGEDAIVEGADYWFFIQTYYDNDGVETLWTTSGYSAEMSIRQGHGEPVLMHATQADYLTVGDSDYTLIIHLPATVTGATTAGSLADLAERGVYDIWLHDGFGNSTMLRDGYVTVRRKVSA